VSDHISIADVQLTALLDRDWQQTLNDYPTYASYLGMGDKSHHTRWADESLDAILARQQQSQKTLSELADINRNALSAAQQVNYDLFRWQLEMDIKSHPFNVHLIPISQRGGVQTLDDFANNLSFNTVEDYQHWLARLAALESLVNQTQKLMEKGIEKGIMPPYDTMARVPAQIRKQIVSEPTQSLFYKPFNKMSDQISEQDKHQIRSQAKLIIANKVIPAYRRFGQFFEQQYLPATRKTHGVWDLPNGKDYYEYLVNYYTTTDLSPDEIHQIGLQEVARNRAEMNKIIEEVGFAGSFAEFLHFLRTDPQFYYQSSQELFDAYLAVSKRLDPKLVTLFGKLPRMPYGLKAIPDAVAPDTTTAYYSRPAADGSRAGYYFVNLYQPETRPKYEMEVLSVHEAVPGHHLQIALQMELGELPMFRRFLGFTVFTEGWGLYSERLGYDMGLYQDPYSRFGQLTYDMWRSVRLVVDTGIHYKGWTRQQAIDYFTENAAKSEQDIINEIDRYISNPGQALAYKIGQLKILELRAKAKQALGDKFDIRNFHDTVLGAGSVPLSVLSENIDKWITAQLQE
jgi:prolyl oligopeptidase